MHLCALCFLCGEKTHAKVELLNHDFFTIINIDTFARWLLLQLQTVDGVPFIIYHLSIII